jgi:VanZ family protein
MRSLRTILGFHSAVSARQLEIWQWKTGLLVTHDARVESDKTQEIKFGVDHVLEPGKLVCIAISSGRNGTRVYVDGQLAQSFPRFEISRNELSGSIILGTSPVRCDPWNGAIKGFAIYAKELMPEEAFQHYQSWTDRSGHSPADLDAAIARYRFEEGAGKEVHNQVSSGPNLEIPATFSVPYKGFLQSPVHEFRPSWKYAWEVVSNIAGFVPLGMVVCSQFAWTKTRWKAILTASAICATLSFAIEVLQYYIPRRGSGITDILTNTLGAVLGAILLQSSLVRKRMQMMGLVPAHQSAPQGE